MKIQFEANLDFQREAINTVVDLFDGQVESTKGIQQKIMRG